MLLLLAGMAMQTTTQAQDESWQMLSSTRDPFSAYCAYFRTPQEGWEAGAKGILHTADGGKTWEKQWAEQGRVLCIYFKNAKDGFAGGESNLYMETHDGGATWKADFSHFQSAKFEKIVFVSEQTGYMFCSVTVYRTTDGGKTWKDIGPKKPSEESSEDYTGFVARDAKHLIVVGRHEMMFTSDNGGDTWVANKKDFFTGPRKNYYSVAFAKDGKTGWISCSDGSGSDIDCLYTTDGGANWTPKKQFNSYQLKKMEFNGNTGWALSDMSSHTMYTTYDGGATWNEETVSKEHKVNTAYLFSPGVGYAGIGGSDYLFNLYVPKK